jgi:hypothetical protein
MRTSARLLLLPLVVAALVLPGPPPASAAVERLVVKTVRIGDKPVRFVLAVDGVKAFVQMKFRRDGRWRTVASDRTDCNYRAGSYDPGLQVQKADRQVLVTWANPGDYVVAEYGGFSVRRKTLEMFGSDGCTNPDGR